MYLYIDTNEEKLAEFTKDTVEWKEYPVEESLPENVVVNEIEGVVVRQGEGRFSLAREAVVFVNMLVLTHNVPAISASEQPDFAEMVDKLENMEKSSFLEPEYYAEASVTSPKNEG